MSLLYKTLPFVEVKAAGGDGSEFEGYCAAFNNVDSYGDVIVPGAFAKCLADFLANGQICFNHGPVIGVPTAAHEDAKGLFVKGRISDTLAGRDCKVLLKDGVIRKMSIGFRTLQRKPAVPDDVQSYWKSIGYQATAEDLANLQANAQYLQFLHELKLYEASPVGFPANTQADITGVKGLPRLSEVRALVAEAKAGKKLSKAMHAYLKAVHDGIAPAVSDLKELLDLHDPSPAGDDKPGDPDDDQGKPKAKALATARAQLALLHPTFARAR